MLTPSSVRSNVKDAHEVINAIGHEPKSPGSRGDGVCRVYGAPAWRHIRMRAGVSALVWSRRRQPS